MTCLVMLTTLFCSSESNNKHLCLTKYKYRAPSMNLLDQDSSQDVASYT